MLAYLLQYLKSCAGFLLEKYQVFLVDRKQEMLLRAATRGKITKIEVLPGFCKIERSASDVAATVAVLVKNSRPELPNKNSTCENVCIAMEKSKIRKITVE